MGLGNALKTLAKRAESLFSSEKLGSPDINALDILANLDRSWSGRARDGPLHYHGPLYNHNHGPSREGSVNRSVRLSYNSAARDTTIRSGISNVSSSSSLRRVSSEPCVINTAMAPGSQNPTPREDSASYVHGHLEHTAPLNIGDGPSSFQLPPMPQRTRRARHNVTVTATAIAATLPSQASAPIGDLEAAADSFSPEDGFSPTFTVKSPRSPVATKQGGLSSALSREASVRLGQHGKAAVEGAQVRALAGDRWGKRYDTYGDDMGDSARRSNDSEDNTDSGRGAAGTENEDDGGTRLNANDLATALGALQTSDNDDQSASQEQHQRNGVIVVDTSLAMDWSDAPSGAVAAANAHKHKNGATAGGGNASGSSLQTPLESNASDSLFNASSEPVDSIDSDSPSSGGNNKEWNTKFIQRWKAVKQRARLQALGVRTIWKFSSPQNGEHHPPELLVNDFQGDLQQRHGSLHAAQVAGGGRGGGRGHNEMPRDPSLATMLLEEVA